MFGRQSVYTHIPWGSASILLQLIALSYATAGFMIAAGPQSVRGKRTMELVSFISIEDEPPDLILSFAIWQPEFEDIRSLIFLRTPEYEFILDETERGVKVSDEALMDEEDDMLKEIEFSDDFVRIITDHHQFDLDLRKIDKEDIEQAKTFLKKMNFDNRFEI